MLNYALAYTPMTYSSHKQNHQNWQTLNEAETTTYRRLIDLLIYLTNTSSNITFVVNYLS